MACLALRYHRSFPMEVKEFGETGWSVHVYLPMRVTPARKLAVVTEAAPGGLNDVLRRAREEIDAFLQANLALA